MTAVIAKGLLKPGVAIPVTYRFKHKDGSWRWIESVATNLLDDPAVRAVVANYRDITTRLEAQEALRLEPDHALKQRFLEFEGLSSAATRFRYPTASGAVAKGAGCVPAGAATVWRSGTEPQPKSNNMQVTPISVSQECFMRYNSNDEMLGIT